VTNEEKMGRNNFDTLWEYFQQCNHRDYPLFKAVIRIMLQKSADIKHGTDKKS
jgi:hypothetical protein